MHALTAAIMLLHHVKIRWSLVW